MIDVEIVHDAQGLHAMVTMVIAVISALVGGGVSALVASHKTGQAYQKLKDDNAAQDEKIVAIEKSQDEMREDFDRRFQEVLDLFESSNGEPRFITYRAHDHMQKHCQQLVYQKMEANADRFILEINHVRDLCERIEENMERRNPTRVSLENCDKKI